MRNQFNKEAHLKAHREMRGTHALAPTPVGFFMGPK